MPYIQEPKPRVTIVPKARINLLQNDYVIDAFVTGWTEPEHTLKSNISQSPLENGALVSDHVVALPVELEMTGMVSDVRDGGDAPGRAWERIRDMHARKTIVNIMTEWGYYSEMVIKNADTKQTGRGMIFRIHFQQILRVGIEIAQIINPENKRTERETYTVVVDVSNQGTLGVNQTKRIVENEGQDTSKEFQESIFPQQLPGAKFEMTQ